MMGLDNGGWSKADDLAQSYEHNFTMKDRVKELESKLDIAISALKHLRTMDTWQNVKQINDFLDETLKEIECQ